MNTRALAAKILTDVNACGVSLTDALAERQRQLSEKNDQALLQELSYGVTRWWWQLDAVIGQLLEKPLKAKDSDIKHLMMTGLYQMRYMRVPDHAAVAETVNATIALKKPWAKNLVNAVLRNYQRNAENIHAALQDNLVASYSHPKWLLEAIRAAWPQHWQSVLEENNQRPPMVLRVNLNKVMRATYREQLTSAGINSTEFLFSDAGLVLEKPVAVEQLPGFAQGHVSVQDGAAQLAAGLLQLGSANNVLDVCAAPGGKTAHILETKPALDQLLAVDIDSERLKKVADNLHRLGLHATLKVGNAQHPDAWWDKQGFDRILLDAPCSATGVIRRHPDIKQLRRVSDIQQLVALQQDILRAVWPLLVSGGILLYATCSILPQENALQIGNFLNSNKDAEIQNISGNWGVEVEYGRQVLPGQDGMDGFYYACIQKQ